MKIEYCTNRYEAADIWQACFPSDSVRFIQFYFQRVYRDEDSLLLRNDSGDACAYLGMLPFTMKFYHETVKSSYLSGVSTLPEHRNKGYMTALVERALTEMYRRGDIVSTLIPARPDLYLRFGYRDCFFHHKQTVRGNGRPDKDISEKTDIARMDSIFRKRFGVRPICLLRTEENWHTIIEEHRLFENGEIFMGNDAYAFVGVYQGKAVVKELGCMNREAYHTMLEHILSMYHEVEVIEPYMDSPSRAPFAQARIINVKSALSAATRANGQTFCIKVKDPLIPENNGAFLAHDGIVETCNDPCEELDIAGLTKRIFSDDGYMNLMLN